MVAVTSLSVAANELRTLLHTEIVGLDVDQIKIGHPKDTFDYMEKHNDKNYLNLFFYNVQYDGYPSDGLGGDPFYVRLYCLITAVGAKKGNPSAGENDLRLVGEVMRVLHEQSLISVNGDNNKEIAQLQIIPHPLNLDNLNHVWSTQGETAYRLSVAYEMALAPIPLAVAVEKSPLVGETGTDVESDAEPEQLPDGGFGIETNAPVVPRVAVDGNKPDWAPHICFLDVSTGILNYTLLIPVSPSVVSGLQLKVLVAGKLSEQVELVWEMWNPDDGVWQRSDTSHNEMIETDIIDPENFEPALATNIDLPIKDKGQATLYAQREWLRPDGSTISLRSNPLLATVYEAGS